MEELDRMDREALLQYAKGVSMDKQALLKVCLANVIPVH
jgi:hypothetical protein